MAVTLKATNLADMYREAAEVYGDRPAFATRNPEKKFDSVSFRELFERGLNLATALIDLGVKARDHVVILSDNRLEWITADYGILLCGAADVPRGSDATDADIEYILNHSDARAVFVEDDRLLRRVGRLKDRLPNIQTIIVMDRETKADNGALHLCDLLEKGLEMRNKGDRRAEERMAGIKPDDLFTLIYTSGTTGVPKGVMLMHSNMISQVHDVPIDIFPEDRMLSILPVWHVFERIFEMLAINRGCCTHYTNIRNIKEDMRIVRPTFMASAPRLWENVYLGILNSVAKAPAVNRLLFAMAHFCSARDKNGRRFLAGRKLNLGDRPWIKSAGLAIISVINIVLFFIPDFLLDLIVLKKIRAATGGNLRGSVSGGGALPLHIDEFFNNIGIPVLEGYGLTETCPVLAVRTFRELVIGSVGPLYPGTEGRIVDPAGGEIIFPPRKAVKGELHVRGPQVMKGYYKDAAATEAVLKDDWFNTGDLGMITYNNTLKIVGRSKETIVLMGGENVEPLPIENRLLKSSAIDQCMVIGQDRKNLAALIVPSLEYFRGYGSTPAELAASEEVQKIIRDEIRRLINQETGFKVFERVVDFRLLPRPFEVGDELTFKFSLKRHVIAEKYTDLINSIY